MKDARTREEILGGLHEVPKIQASQAVCRGVRVLQGGLRTSLHAAVQVKPKLCILSWSPQDVGDAKTTGSLLTSRASLRKCVCYRQKKRKSRATQDSLRNPRCQTCCYRTWYFPCWGSVPSFLPIPPFLPGEYLLHTIVYWKYIIYFLESRKRLGLLNCVETAKDYEDF